jgi:6,7-dimethyl-8-ribityllumazine synthase
VDLTASLAQDVQSRSPVGREEFEPNHSSSTIVAAGVVVDGGIYRHEFVADTVIKALMDVQLRTEVPVFPRY